MFKIPAALSRTDGWREANDIKKTPTEEGSNEPTKQKGKYNQIVKEPKREIKRNSKNKTENKNEIDDL